MKNADIIAQRLRHQLISHSPFSTPYEVVQWMGAIQAQDYRSSLWAIGLRMSPSVSSNEGIIEQAMAERKIVRTWPMRGTLHWVAAEDVRWMLRFLTPRVIQGSLGRYKQLELDENIFIKSRVVFEKTLEGGKNLTRAELFGLLEQKGIHTHDQRGIHILGHWAMKGLICQGPKKGLQPTFCLLEEWLPSSTVWEGDEALATLASRFFKSRGPATPNDFANWSGLKVSEAKRGLEIIGPQLEKCNIEGIPYWFPTPENERQGAVKTQNAWLLPAFDEMLCGYKDRRALLDSAEIKAIILRNGIFKPIVILDNRAVGTWQRTIKNNRVFLKFFYFQNLSKSKRARVLKNAQSLESFFEMEVVAD